MTTVFEDTGSTSTLDEISRELLRCLPDGLNDQSSNRAWTKALTDRLCEMGEGRGVLACGHGAKFPGEWLLDVVWMMRERHEIALAVESE